MNDQSKPTPRPAARLIHVGSESLAQIDGGKCKVANDGYLIPDCMLSKGQLAYRNAVRANLANGHH